MALDVVINGAARSFPSLEGPCLLERLLRDLSLQSDRVAVERNGVIVSRADWDRAMVADGDRLEIVHFVGGGSLPRANR